MCSQSTFKEGIVRFSLTWRECYSFSHFILQSQFYQADSKRWEEGEYPDLIKILQHIKGSDAKVCRVPMIKILNVDEIIKFAREVWDINQYIPDFDKKYPPRQWLCTVGIFVYSLIHSVNTLAGEEFKKFIMSKLEKREKEIVVMKKLQVNASPEFVELLKKSKLKSRKTVDLFFISSIFSSFD